MQSISAIAAKRMGLSKIHLSPTVICSFIYEELRHSRPLKAPGGEGDESCTFSSVRNIFCNFTIHDIPQTCLQFFSSFFEIKSPDMHVYYFVFLFKRVTIHMVGTCLQHLYMFKICDLFPLLSGVALVGGWGHTRGR